jgi:hypothetical protein
MQRELDAAAVEVVLHHVVDVHICVGRLHVVGQRINDGQGRSVRDVERNDRLIVVEI